MASKLTKAERQKLIRESKQLDADFMGQLQGFVDFCLSSLEEEAGLNLRDMCLRVKLSRATILRLRKHSFTPGTHARTLMKLAKATDCKLAWGGVKAPKPAKLAPTTTVRRRRSLQTR